MKNLDRLFALQTVYKTTAESIIAAQKTKIEELEKENADLRLLLAEKRESA